MNQQQHKKSYTKPELSSLGSVEKLTLNRSWWESDYAVARANSKSTAVFKGGHDIS